MAEVLERLDAHRGGGEGEGKADDHEGVAVESQGPTGTHDEEGGNEHLCSSASEDDAAEAHEFADREFDPEGEHEEDYSEFGEGVDSIFRVFPEKLIHTGVGEEDAAEEISDQKRLVKAHKNQ